MILIQHRRLAKPAQFMEGFRLCGHCIHCSDARASKPPGRRGLSRFPFKFQTPHIALINRPARLRWVRSPPTKHRPIETKRIAAGSAVATGA